MNRQDGSEKKKKKTLREKLEEMPLSSYVVFSITILLIYTAVELVLVSLTEMSHDTLTTCFYSVFGGEILACALIKIFKLKEEGMT